MGGKSMRKYLIRDNVPKVILLNHLLLLWFISACAYVGFITYYDPITYKSLTDLKPEVMALYGTFTTDSVDASQIAATRLKLAQIYEYEKGKGEKNRETYEQIKKIQAMFERHVSDRLTTGRWTTTHLNNQKQNIAEAFDIAIKTERLKNKNE
ncbi:MAG: hypothetical protein A3G93_07595 [Nitrospinae bacterium RIFCSPLOWO2_12_FULL_45_22]|nr:MAG: hypothetical protein A3G93_07595 [Nitrospinae bacterium RIFCSPLOWO2_12_FULL_45_22]